MSWSGCYRSRLARCGECEGCQQTSLDESEAQEIVRMDGALVAVIHTGLQMAEARVRGAYIQGRIDVDEFEAEIERILRKRASLHA